MTHDLDERILHRPLAHGLARLGVAQGDRVMDLVAATMQVSKNGQPCGSATGAAVQGHPAEAWPANTLGAFGIPFPAGEVILSGALAARVPAAAGDHFHMQIEGLGGCSIAFTD